MTRNLLEALNLFVKYILFVFFSCPENPLSRPPLSISMIIINIMKT